MTESRLIAVAAAAAAAAVDTVGRLSIGTAERRRIVSALGYIAALAVSLR